MADAKRWISGEWFDLSAATPVYPPANVSVLCFRQVSDTPEYWIGRYDGVGAWSDKGGGAIAPSHWSVLPAGPNIFNV